MVQKTELLTVSLGRPKTKTYLFLWAYESGSGMLNQKL